MSTALGPAPVATAPASGSWLRRHRAVVGIVLGVLVVLVALTLVAGRSQRQDGDLDPDNPGPGGAQGVARVLADHGVPVDVVRRAAELDDATVDRRTTLLVTSTPDLGTASTRRLRDRAADAGAVVLAAPGDSVLRGLGLRADRAAVTAGRTVGASCADPLLSGLRLQVPPASGYRTDDPSATACFTGEGPRAGSYVVRVESRGGDVPTYLLGATDLMSNQRVRDGDDAAVALRLLGQGDRLVWYVPDPRDVRVGDTGNFSAQLPRGLVPAVWLVVAALLATVLWRGRRLGPLVVEPLPVVVKAVESTQGRGRLYRRVRDREHAASVLRQATAARLARRLRLPATTDLDHLAAAVAAATGRAPASVHDVLAGPPVTDDRALTRLAADLAALEKEI